MVTVLGDILKEYPITTSTTGFELSTHIWPTKEINFSVFPGD